MTLNALFLTTILNGFALLGFAEVVKPCSDVSFEQCVEEDRWKWSLDGVHRCNVKRITFSQLYTSFSKHGLPPLYKYPIIVYGDRANDNANICQEFKKMTSLSNITDTLPTGFEVTLSSSNSFSAHRRTIPLTQYLSETVEEETFPDHLSNETWYLFGETYTSDWVQMLDHFCLPPCETCSKDLSALAFGIGGKGSGVQWHIHGPGFSECIHGRKHWVLYPPENKPKYDPDYTSRHWMEEVYTSLNESERPYECTLHPGEMIYFPNEWFHATINLDNYNVFVSTFTTEHDF